MTAERMGQPGFAQPMLRWSSTTVAPLSITARASSNAWVRWWSPSPSQTRSPPESHMATEAAPSILRRCLAAREVPSGVNPSPSRRAASEAVCRVR
jgi:hypothetical protein